jgi:hypothetical protein
MLKPKLGKGKEQDVAEYNFKEQGKTRRDKVLESRARYIKAKEGFPRGLKGLLIEKENNIKAKVLCCGRGPL